MKKNSYRSYLSLLVLLFGCFTYTNAQIAIGIQGGSNLSKMDFTNNPDFKFTEINYRQGFIGGFVFEYVSDKHAGLQLELNYTQRGWVENDTTAGNMLKYKNQMDYLELPFLTHVNIGNGNFRGVINMGLYAAYALNRKIVKTDIKSAVDEDIAYTFDKDKDNRIDFGLLAGGGFEYRFPFGRFTVEARYTFGLGDVNKIKTYKSEVSQFRVLTVLGRFTFPLSKVGQVKPTSDLQ